MMKRNDKGRHKNSKLHHYLRNEEINWLNNLSGGERSLKNVCLAILLSQISWVSLFCASVCICNLYL